MARHSSLQLLSLRCPTPAAVLCCTHSARVPLPPAGVLCWVTTLLRWLTKTGGELTVGGGVLQPPILLPLYCCRMQARTAHLLPLGRTARQCLRLRRAPSCVAQERHHHQRLH